MMMPIVNSTKPYYYSESEAAQRLGLSVEQLRVLVQRHIIAGDPDSKPYVSSFSSSELVLLRFVSGQFSDSSH